MKENQKINTDIGHQAPSLGTVKHLLLNVNAFL